MIRDLVKHDDPILREVMPDLDFKEHSAEDIKSLCDDLVESVQEYKGLGLAANQIGLRMRAFVLWTSPTIIAINPRVVYESDDLQYSDEACLSFPGVVMKIKRPMEIRVRYYEPNGEIVSKTFKGMTAKAFHHEMDHLNGVDFFERAGRYHRDRGKKQLAKAMRMLRKAA